jgi:hypothetical protein
LKRQKSHWTKAIYLFSFKSHFILLKKYVWINLSPINFIMPNKSLAKDDVTPNCKLISSFEKSLLFQWIMTCVLNHNIIFIDYFFNCDTPLKKIIKNKNQAIFFIFELWGFDHNQYLWNVVRLVLSFQIVANIMGVQMAKMLCYWVMTDDIQDHDFPSLPFRPLPCLSPI